MHRSTRRPAPSLAPTSGAAIALGGALLALAWASPLIVWAERDLSPSSVIFNRLWLAAALFVLWSGFQRWRSPDLTAETAAPPTLDARLIGLLAIAGISFAGSLALWADALTQTSIANATLLHNFMPIFAALGSWLLCGTQFKRQFLAGMGVAVAGTLLLGVEDLQLAAGLAGDAIALLSALLAAVTLLCIERLRAGQIAAPRLLTWTSAFGSLALLPWVYCSDAPLWPTTLSGWVSVLALAAVCQGLGQGLLTYSLKYIAASAIAVLLLIVPVLAALLAALLFDQQLSLLNWVAFATVLAGIYLAVSAKTAAIVPAPAEAATFRGAGAGWRQDW